MSSGSGEGIDSSGLTRELATLVVPAKAGTHTAESLCGLQLVETTFAKPRPVVMGPGLRRDNAGRFSDSIFKQRTPSLRANGSARSAAPMTGSAKQSRARLTTLDCFVAYAPRNDGGETHIRILAARFARALHLASPSKKTEGAGKAGWPLHPGPPRKRNLRERALTTGTGGNNRPSLRSGLRLITCSPR